PTAPSPLSLHDALPISPVLEQIAAEHVDVKITKVNVDEEPALAERYRVRGIPYVAMFRDGKLAEQVVGYRPKAALEAGLGINAKDRKSTRLNSSHEWTS